MNGSARHRPAVYSQRRIAQRWLLSAGWHPGLLALELATSGLAGQRSAGRVGINNRPISWLGAYRRLVEQVLAGQQLAAHQLAVSRAVTYLDGLLAHPRRLGPLGAAELRSVQDDLVYLLELIDQQQRTPS